MRWRGRGSSQFKVESHSKLRENRKSEMKIENGSETGFAEMETWNGLARSAGGVAEERVCCGAGEATAGRSCGGVAAVFDGVGGRGMFLGMVRKILWKLEQN